MGEPEPNFRMILSAQPGHGKTTFSLKFANYLSKHFGKAVYITNEENASRIKRKLDFIDDSISENFELAFDADDYDKTHDLIASGRFKFIFIDSAQGGGMDYKELWSLYKEFEDLAFVTICRETKDGKARGSQNKEYDGDITINFKSPGVATTIKNRFGEVGREFVLF